MNYEEKRQRFWIFPGRRGVGKTIPSDNVKKENAKASPTDDAVAFLNRVLGPFQKKATIEIAAQYLRVILPAYVHFIFEDIFFGIQTESRNNWFKTTVNAITKSDQKKMEEESKQFVELARKKIDLFKEKIKRYEEELVELDRDYPPLPDEKWGMKEMLWTPRGRKYEQMETRFEKIPETKNAIEVLEKAINEYKNYATPVATVPTSTPRSR